jgi:tetratricopeptide (TPR) repeat protein
MKSIFLIFAMMLTLGAPLSCLAQDAGKTSKPDAITVTEGEITLPTYEQVGRFMQPPLFADSTLQGIYPFTTFKREFKTGGPLPEKYHAIFVESEYFKLTYIPELGGRFMELYDKVHERETFYHNDVIKPTYFNPRFDWPQEGIELTGPFDEHSLTWHGEPYWSHLVLRHKDGSVSVLLGELDPIYQMDVTFTATLHPGVDALEIRAFCYNGNDGEKPQMLWTNAAFPVTPKTRFLYPMTETVGHTTGVVSPWPIYNGVDLSWAHNHMSMLGVFGIDSYDNYGGAYQFDQDYGVFRYADRRVVQGMKMWTFGFGPGSSEVEHGYTDKAGPYWEAQSGRMVWDGHYEWVYPHQVEQWREWWIPVAGIDGLTTMSNDVALNLDVHADAAGMNSSVDVALSPVRPILGAKLRVKASSGELLNTTVDLIPGTPVKKTVAGIHADSAGLEEMEVEITAPNGAVLLDYRRPDSNPGGHDTPFAKGLKDAPIPLEKMTAEQLVIAAEFKQKDLNSNEAAKLAKLALEKDPGYSAAHQLLGILEFNQEHFKAAAAEFQLAVDRDPYADASWYYLATSEMKLGEEKLAEDNFYFVWPGSGYYGAREYQLGLLNFKHHDLAAAAEHLTGAIKANAQDLSAHLLLALTERDEGDKDAALEQLAQVEEIDPADRVAQAEKYFLIGDEAVRDKLIELMGERTESAMEVSIFYSSLGRWKEAAAVLKMVEPPRDKDTWGTPPLYFYTLAYAVKQAGDAQAAAEYRKKARAAAGTVERFAYRAESEAPLADAVKENPKDTQARFDLGCLLYYRGRKAEAIEEWEAINQVNAADFGARRSLGLAYEEGGQLEKAIPQLKKAVEINPKDEDTLNDLATAYARAGKFDEQLALLEDAIKRTPNNDRLVEGVLAVDLIEGRFDAAQEIVDHHTFSHAEGTDQLRDDYRELKYGRGSEAYNKGNYELALKLFQSALKPPANLGLDDTEHQSAPRLEYYIGRTLDALGRKQEAQQAYQEGIGGVDHLAGGGGDSWSPDNFFIVLSLEKLGRHMEAANLAKQFKTVADSRQEGKEPFYVARATYLQGLIASFSGDPEEGHKLIAQAVQIEPNYIEPRFELRGDAIDAAGRN